MGIPQARSLVKTTKSTNIQTWITNTEITVDTILTRRIIIAWI